MNRRPLVVGSMVATLTGGAALFAFGLYARRSSPPPPARVVTTVKHWNRAPTVFTSADEAKATKALKHLALGGYTNGDVVYNANEILGLVALQEGRVADAKAFLLKAGASKGSPVLGSFGPSLLLARRLTERGETTVVLQHLDQVEKFWAKPPGFSAKQAAEVWASPRFSVKFKKATVTLEDVKRGERLSRDNERTLDEWRAQVRQGKVPRHWLWNLDPTLH